MKFIFYFFLLLLHLYMCQERKNCFERVYREHKQKKEQEKEGNPGPSTTTSAPPVQPPAPIEPVKWEHFVPFLIKDIPKEPLIVEYDGIPRPSTGDALNSAMVVKEPKLWWTTKSALKYVVLLVEVDMEHLNEPQILKWMVGGIHGVLIESTQTTPTIPILASISNISDVEIPTQYESPIQPPPQHTHSLVFLVMDEKRPDQFKNITSNIQKTAFNTTEFADAAGKIVAGNFFLIKP